MYGMLMINEHANIVLAEFSLIRSEIVALFNVIFYMANLADSKSSAGQYVSLLIFNYFHFRTHLHTVRSGMHVRVCAFA